MTGKDVPKPGQKVKYVERNDPGVETGFSRLGRLLQLKRLPLDAIQKELFEDQVSKSHAISIVHLSNLLKVRLELTNAEAVRFARFLIEEKDEENPKVDTIAFNPELKVNMQYIPIRLMTHFKTYP